MTMGGYVPSPPAGGENLTHQITTNADEPSTDVEYDDGHHLPERVIKLFLVCWDDFLIGRILSQILLRLLIESDQSSAPSTNSDTEARLVLGHTRRHSREDRYLSELTRKTQSETEISREPQGFAVSSLHYNLAGEI